MAQTTVTDLRQHLATWLDRVQRGEEVVITERGVDVARLVPVASRRDAARARLAAWRGRLILGEVDSPLASEDWDATR